MIKLWSILKKVGKLAITTSTGSTAGAILTAVNAVLPSDKQLPDNATGDQAMEAIEELPANERAAIMDKKFDVDITQIKESNETLRTMLTANATSTHTTRPMIAYEAFQVTAAIHLIIVVLWAWAVITSESTNKIQDVMNGYPFVLSLTATFTTLILAYFGILKQEKSDTLNASNGLGTKAVQSGLLGIAGKILGRK